MTESRSSADWADAYAQLRPTYQAFAERLADLLETLLDDEGLPYFRIYDWASDADYVEEAIDRAWREGRSLGDPLDELPDLAGVSLVCFTVDQAARVAEVVERELEIDSEASVSFANVSAQDSERQRQDFNELEYPYARYIAMLDNRRASLPEWAQFADIDLQIDVQTFLQYTWEKLETNYLAFHWPSSYAAGVRDVISRALSNVIAADRELMQVDREADEIFRDYRDAVSDGELDLDVNATSLAAYLRHSPLVHEVIAIAASSGLQEDDDPGYTDAWGLEQRLLWLCRVYAADTLRAIDDLLQVSLERAREILGEIARLSSERGFVPWATAESVIVWLILVLKRAGAETVALASFNDEVTYALNTIIGNPTEPAGAP